MLGEYKTKTNLGVGIGFVMLIAARFIIAGAGDNLPLLLFGIAFGLVGDVLFIWGCCMYALGKGYPWPVGLLGLLSCLGLLILVLLPDKNK